MSPWDDIVTGALWILGAAITYKVAVALIEAIEAMTKVF